MDEIACFKKPHWILAFIVIHCFNIAFIYVTITFDPWFHQHWEYGSETLTFDGDLYQPGTLIEDFCDHWDDSYNNCFDNCKDYAKDNSINNGICDRYENWYKSGIAYLVLNLIAMALSALMILILIKEMCKNRHYATVFNIYLTGYCMIVVFVLNFTAFLIWALGVKLTFGSCSHDNDFRGVKSVCNDTGAQMAIFIVVWLFTITPFYFIISRSLRKVDVRIRV